MKFIILISTVIFTSAVAGVSFYAINQFSDLKKMEIENEYRFFCAQSYTYTETLPNKAQVSYPMKKEYEACLKEKGL